MKDRSHDELILVRDREMVRARRPLLIAHRGGIVGPHSPENTLVGIELAALYRYDMVELDVRQAKDGEPIIFHDGHLMRNCGVNEVPENLTSAQLSRIRHVGSDQHIPALGEALALCRKLNLGVMFDIKPGWDAPARREIPFSDRFLGRIGSLVEEHRLASSCLTITGDPVLREYLGGFALLTVGQEEAGLVTNGERVPLSGRFWFGLPQDLPDGAIRPLQENGALVIPAINTFRYPAHAHRELARRDVSYLSGQGVDGFQIDSCYGEFFVP